MEPTYIVTASIAPLATTEVVVALRSIRQVWQPPAWVKRQPINNAWLLLFRHEAPLRSGNTPDEFAERLAAAIWMALGRFVRIQIEINTEDTPVDFAHIFEEADYWPILRTYRFSRSAH